MRAPCSTVLNRVTTLPQSKIDQRCLSTLATFHFHYAGGHAYFITQESAAGLAAHLYSNCWLFLNFHHDATPFRACASWIK